MSKGHIGKCSHACKCDCHTKKGILHSLNCCEICQICFAFIDKRLMDAHKIACHGNGKNSKSMT
jgi:hypothetical protein